MHSPVLLFDDEDSARAVASRLGFADPAVLREVQTWRFEIIATLALTLFGVWGAYAGKHAFKLGIALIIAKWRPDLPAPTFPTAFVLVGFIVSLLAVVVAALHRADWITITRDGVRVRGGFARFGDRFIPARRIRRVTRRGSTLRLEVAGERSVTVRTRSAAAARAAAEILRARMAESAAADRHMDGVEFSKTETYRAPSASPHALRDVLVTPGVSRSKRVVAAVAFAHANADEAELVRIAKESGDPVLEDAFARVARGMSDAEIAAMVVELEKTELDVATRR